MLMALALEKVYMQKVAQMPQKEVELLPQAAKAKSKHSSVAGNEPFISPARYDDAQ